MQLGECNFSNDDDDVSVNVLIKYRLMSVQVNGMKDISRANMLVNY